MPTLLARASWAMRAPRAAIVLWQSVALAAVLSAFSAGIAPADETGLLRADASLYEAKRAGRARSVASAG